MQALNNFDKSSTGINITCDFGFDHIASECFFDQTFTRLESGEFLYSSQLEDPSNFEKTFSLPSAKQLFIDYVGYHHESGTKKTFSVLKETLIDLQDFGDDFDLKTVTVETLSENIKNCITYYQSSKEAELFFEQNYKPNFKSMQIHGFCQGDTQTVIIPECSIEVSNSAGFFDTLQNIIYSLPVHIAFHVTTSEGEDFNVEPDSLLDNLYTYKKGDVLESIKSLDIPENVLSAIIDFAENNLPLTVG